MERTAMALRKTRGRGTGWPLEWALQPQAWLPWRQLGLHTWLGVWNEALWQLWGRAWQQQHCIPHMRHSEHPAPQKFHTPSVP